MSNLTPELNLKTAVDDDDTADYLTLDLAGSLNTLDGLFNATTGHTHNGTHQGGALQFMDFTVGEDLVVQATSTLKGAVYCQSTLSTTGLATLNSLDVTTTSHLRGAVTIDGTINSAGTLTVGGALSVGTTLSVGSNATITGTLTAGAITTGGGNLTVGGAVSITGLLTAGRIAIGGYDPGSPWNAIKGNVITDGFFYQRGSGSTRVWDNADFTFSASPTASTLVQRDGNGYINASYINYTGDTQGGKPAQVLGRTSGDNYLRWWPTNAIGPPISTWTWQGSLGSFGNDIGTGRLLDVSETSDPQGLASASGTTITVSKAGYYYVYAVGHSTSVVWNDDWWWELRVWVNGANQGSRQQTYTILPSSPTGAHSRTHATWLGFVAAGGTVSIWAGRINGGGYAVVCEDGFVEMTFIPTATYNN